MKVTKVSANGDLDQETINKIVENANAKFVLVGAALTGADDGARATPATLEHTDEAKALPALPSS